MAGSNCSDFAYNFCMRLITSTIAVLCLVAFMMSCDESKEIRMCHIAAERGNAEAQYQLAVRYLTGEGISRDDEEMWYWLSKGNYPFASTFVFLAPSCPFSH